MAGLVFVVAVVVIAIVCLRYFQTTPTSTLEPVCCIGPYKSWAPGLCTPKTSPVGKGLRSPYLCPHPGPFLFPKTICLDLVPSTNHMTRLFPKHSYEPQAALVLGKLPVFFSDFPPSLPLFQEAATPFRFRVHRKTAAIQ